MIARIQKLPQGLRTFVFFAGVVVVVGIIVGITQLVSVLIVLNSTRETPVPLVENTTTAEYMTLPDADSYPSTVTVDAKGTVYSGSYVTGAVWAMDTLKNIREIPQTRDKIGSLSAITVAPDGTLYLLDRMSPYETLGTRIWTLTADDTLTLVKDITGADADTIQLPDDIVVDTQGRMYITDRGIDHEHDVVWRILADGTLNVWWQSPNVGENRTYAPTGLAYNPENSTLYISDSFIDIIYGVKINEDGSAGDNQTIYDRHYSQESVPPGFDGMTIGADGKLIIAALGSNRVGVYDPNTGLMTYIAGNYRGAVDVAYDALTQRIFVANWDQRALLPSQALLIMVQTTPHLPFTIDTITQK